MRYAIQNVKLRADILKDSARFFPWYCLTATPLERPSLIAEANARWKGYIKDYFKWQCSSVWLFTFRKEERPCPFITSPLFFTKPSRNSDTFRFLNSRDAYRTLFLRNLLWKYGTVEFSWQGSNTSRMTCRKITRIIVECEICWSRELRALSVCPVSKYMKSKCQACANSEFWVRIE